MVELKICPRTCAHTLSAATALLEGLAQFLFTYTEVKYLPSSAHRVPRAVFTKETALLFLLDALRDSLSRAQACCLIQEELSSSSSRSPAVCPRASAMIHPQHEARPAAGTRGAAAPRAMGSHDSSQHCFAKPLAELCPKQTHSVRKVLMGTRKD